MISEIRKDYLLNKYAIIAPARAKRPFDSQKKAGKLKTAGPVCPFCPENIDKNNILDRIGSIKKWQTVSLSNIFPAITPGNKRAYGYQEVIVETPDHGRELADLSLADIENVLKMFIRRTKALSRDKKIDYILCYKNNGATAGASLDHSHSQIFASEILPPDVKDELSLARDFKDQTGNCFWCDLIAKEMKTNRLIFKNKEMIAIAPYASQFHYEAWIFARRHIDNITRLNEAELKSLAKVLKLLLVKIKKLNLPYNFFLHQVISDRGQHFCLKIQPRGSVWAGVELGSGLVINTVTPESAADYYKK